MEGVIAVHMDSLDHAMVSRQALRDYAEVHGIRQSLQMAGCDSVFNMFKSSLPLLKTT